MIVAVFHTGLGRYRPPFLSVAIRMGNEMHFPLDGRTSLLPPRGIAREIYGRLPSGLFVVRWNGPPPSRVSRFDKWVARLVESHNPYEVRSLLRLRRV